MYSEIENNQQKHYTQTKNKMKKFILALILASVAAPAFADTSARNEWRTGTEIIRGKTQFSSYRSERGTFHRGSESVKFDTNFPNAWANFSIDGTINIHGGVNTTGPDPYVVLGRSYDNESGSFYNVDRATGYQTIYGHYGVRSHEQTLSY